MSVPEPVNILLVDDLPENLLVLQSILGDLGENLITASSGAEALQQVLKHDFAVILIDVNMPGIDGMEAAELIRRRKRSAHTPIIFMTAYADELHTARGYSLGAVDCILSPVVPDVLRTKVKVFVDLFRMSRTIQRQADERVALAEERARRTAAEESTRHYTFLAEAGRALAASLDFEATCRSLAQILIPLWADWMAVSPSDPCGGFSETILHCAVDRALSEEERIIKVNAGEFPPWQEITAELAAGHAAADAELPREYSRPQSASNHLLLPLRARGKHLGILVLGRNAARAELTDADLHLVNELAGRAAVALENARLYSELQRADREKNEFLSMLAHELRNPLASICTAVHLLQMPAIGDQDIEWVRDVISRQMAQLVRMVDDLLDVSRITQGKIRLQLSPLKPREFLQRAIETSRPLIESRRHQLEVSVDEDLPVLQGDTFRLTQVVANLLNNAAKYTPEGGHIWLSACCEGGELVVRVKDNGIGIPPAMLARVFDLFTQDTRSLDRSQGGLGIGLTLVRRLTELHAGSVQVFSEGEHRGSEFLVRLPIVAAEIPADLWPDGAAQPVAASAPRQILVVDDNTDAANGLARVLRSLNYDVTVAHDGPAAFEMFEEVRPDAVLLDIGLPGMDGYEVARRLRQKDSASSTLLVAITGYGQEEDHRRSYEAGFNHHLVKPVNLSALTALLDTLDERTSHEPLGLAEIQRT